VTVYLNVRVRLRLHVTNIVKAQDRGSVEIGEEFEVRLLDGKISEFRVKAATNADF
jgi:hypothetical protein